MDLAGVASEKWSTLFVALQRPQPAGARVGIAQLIECDKQLFIRASYALLAKLSRDEKGGLDAYIERATRPPGQRRQGLPTGCVPKMPDGKPICFAYNRGQCKYKGPGQRCARRHHVCYTSTWDSRALLLRGRGHFGPGSQPVVPGETLRLGSCAPPMIAWRSNSTQPTRPPYAWSYKTRITWPTWH